MEFMILPNFYPVRKLHVISFVNEKNKSPNLKMCPQDIKVTVINCSQLNVSVENNYFPVMYLINSTKFTILPVM